MTDITHKHSTLRIAVAQATVRVGSETTLNAVLNKEVPKGDVLEMSKTAGLFAAKKTSDMIPDCHPMPIEKTEIRFHIADLKINIEVEVHTIYKTGVEVEAMHAASVVALTMYDMLKPIDKQICIEEIKLIQKKGGKSDFDDGKAKSLKAMVIVCSDSIAQGKKQDRSGKVIVEKLEKLGVEIAAYNIIPDEKIAIEEMLQKGLKLADLIIYTGGTGLSKRDITTDTLTPLIDRRIVGIEEAIRNYGQQRTPYAMLSRSVVGMIGEVLVMALPGSTGGARESMDAIFPAVLHIFPIQKGLSHDL